MTDKQKSFVDNYLSNGFNATQAALDSFVLLYEEFERCRRHKNPFA